MANCADEICLDFFAGSCTTAQAVLELNHSDNSSRRFIMVQLPESTRQQSLQTIAEIGKERIRRAIARLKSRRADQLDLDDRDAPEDLGFRVFKLDRSNYKAWRDFDGGDVAGLQTLSTSSSRHWPRAGAGEPAGRGDADGRLPARQRRQPAPAFTQNTVQVVTSDLVAHRLFVCLDARIADATIAGLAMDADDVFICLDSALSDEAKVQLEDGRQVKVI